MEMINRTNKELETCKNLLFQRRRSSSFVRQETFIYPSQSRVSFGSLRGDQGGNGSRKMMLEHLIVSSLRVKRGKKERTRIPRVIWTRLTVNSPFFPRNLLILIRYTYTTCGHQMMYTKYYD